MLSLDGFRLDTRSLADDSAPRSLAADESNYDEAARWLSTHASLS